MNPLVILAAAAAAGLAYSAGYEVRAFTTRRFDVPVLPPGAQPIRVLHLSDLHLTPSQRRKAAWLRSLAAEQPDLVVVTGDFIAHADGVPAVLEALAPLRAFPGVFVFGSNDYYAPRPKNPARYLGRDTGRRIHGDELPWSQLLAGLEAGGWRSVSQRRTILTIKGTRLEFRGVDDPHLGRDDYREVAGPMGEADVALGVSHAPYLRVLDGMESDGVALVLAGHTHGGQLCLPGVGALVTNCDLDRKRAKGLHRHKRAWLHVSAGIGTNPFTPVRFACRPEAIVLTLLPGR